jgi:hypothetical protein
VVHHVIHWIHGGATVIENLALICTAHHRFLHERGWTLRRDPHLKTWILEPPPDIGISA